MVDPTAPKVKPTTAVKVSKQQKILAYLTTGEEEEKQANSPELEMYLADPVLVPSGDPLSWWRANQTRYPNLARLARIFLAIPATSVPSEQLFSTAGDTLTKKRNRLAGETLEGQVFLYKNYDLLKAVQQQ